MNRRIFLFALVILSLAIGIHFHTNYLVVTHHKTGSGNKVLKIAHISDLHTQGLGKLEKQLVEALEIEKPDIIVITGDLATPSGTTEGYRDVLKNFKAPKGVFFVQGNWEFWEPIQELSKILSDSKITDLTNKVHQLDENLWLVGFDDSEEGNPQADLINSLPKESAKIGIFHSPIFFDKIAVEINLNLAGHTHGGQMQIPLFGSFWTPQGTGPYVEGWFEKNNSKLFVSRGIGTSVLPIRFNCSPELAIIEFGY